jgi:hypothetical protein
VAHGEGGAFSADVLKNAGIQVSLRSVLQWELVVSKYAHRRGSGLFVISSV